MKTIIKKAQIRVYLKQKGIGLGDTAVLKLEHRLKEMIDTAANITTINKLYFYFKFIYL